MRRYPPLRDEAARGDCPHPHRQRTPLKILDAMAMGKVIISTRLGARALRSRMARTSPLPTPPEFVERLETLPGR